MYLEFVGYEVYCQAQLFLSFIEGLVKLRDIVVPSEDVSHVQD